MQSTLLEQGVALMLFGMGTVFLFLALLVVSTYIMSMFVSKCLPEPVIDGPEPAPLAKPAGAAVDSKTLAVIQDAIIQHRAKK